MMDYKDRIRYLEAENNFLKNKCKHKLVPFAESFGGLFTNKIYYAFLYCEKCGYKEDLG